MTHPNWCIIPSTNLQAWPTPCQFSPPPRTQLLASRLNMKSLSSLLEKKRRLEAEREELFRRLEEVEREIKNTQAECGAIYNIDSPILSLPAEITCSIFLQALEFRDEDGCIDTHATELTISHVCRQWRAAAIALPSLWSSFYYHGPSASPATPDRFKAYLDRSKSNTLELWLDLRKTTPDEQVWAILEETIAVVSRWRVVSIFSDSSEIASQLKSKALHAPNLEHLTLQLDLKYTPNRIFRHLEPQFITEGAPKLTSAWLDVSVPVVCLPPISTLTTLRIEFLEDSKAISPILSSAALQSILTLPNLENLSLAEVEIIYEYGFDPSVMRNHPILMNSLRHLRIDYSEDLCRLLPIIRAPLLETLVLLNMSIGFAPSVIPFRTDMPVYSFPSLTSLSLLHKRCDAEPESLWHFVLMTNAARKITVLRGSNLKKGILYNIVQGLPSRMPLWPHLETLTCDFGPLARDFLDVPFEFQLLRKNTEVLTLVTSENWMVALKNHALPNSTFAGLLAIEAVSEGELRHIAPWPPGAHSLSGKRIGFETDRITTRLSESMFAY
ncbi:hypothetical protein M413DRAFT_21864 [Hebeloma cylindrosporum]|uniref:Uncharacterized protein n=1 Tax=Hebeloma cylindrosporum TaxID=76867 RepID=A0A0C3CZW8_HEBCY|nr:hypothetical protein M413DRAFT_21864 [Hebeloma cylindrosporum h7]